MNITKDDQKALDAAAAVIATAQQKVDRLHTSRNGVTLKLDQLKADAADAVAAAKAIEQQEANTMAAAVANGADAKEIQQSEQRLAEAAAAVSSARNREQQGTAMLDALEVQAVSLAEQIETAERELGSAIARGNRVRRIVLAQEWNRELDALKVIGAELVFLLPESGFHCLKDMRIPVFDAEGVVIWRRDVDRATLLEQGGGVTAWSHL